MKVLGVIPEQNYNFKPFSQSFSTTCFCHSNVSDRLGAVTGGSTGYILSQNCFWEIGSLFPDLSRMPLVEMRACCLLLRASQCNFTWTDRSQWQKYSSLFPFLSMFPQAVEKVFTQPLDLWLGVFFRKWVSKLEKNAFVILPTTSTLLKNTKNWDNCSLYTL